MSLFGSSPLGGGSAAGGADYAVPSPPTDGISSLSFNAQTTLLVASSWDNCVRCWELQRAGAGAPATAVPRAQMQHSAPALCTAFHSDGATVFTGGVDNVVKKWSLGAPGQPSEDIGRHEAAVRSVHWIPALQLVASGSWDRTIRFWDTRQPSPAHTLQLTDRLYDLDIRENWMVAATADRKLSVYNLADSCKCESRAESTLKYQTRCVSIFPDLAGYAVGSIEGRVAIEYFNELPNADGVARVPQPNPKKAFAFKCHRETVAAKNVTNVYAINAIAFHPYGTFATVGSCGTFNFWDKDSRQRLKAFPKANAPISCAAFSPDGSIFGYAVSYDWSQGHQEAQPNAQHSIMLHTVQEDEVKPRDKPRK